MRKVINEIQWIIVIYGLALGFVLVMGEIPFKDSIQIFIVSPLVYFIAIYMYKGVREIKHDSAKIINDLKVDCDTKDKQIANHQTIADSKIERIFDLNKEITELKIERERMVKGESWNMSYVDKSKPLPFSEKVSDIEAQWICPECGKTMTRETNAIIFCDNIECTRKQWRKDSL